PKTHHAQVDGILSYINQHLAEDLSIPMLASQFYLSGSYLCKIFKDATGTTINRYITAKRIARAKALLAEGHSVAETSSLCGFGDYSNFLKAFTRIVGISPKKYASYARG
ncbi:MAG: AraC family transcriptional regulator, partial [Oscillospiraceae bacterium]|nr:AraC family transcriptional regulator [Oscillospiraceae bacterium]